MKLLNIFKRKRDTFGFTQKEKDLIFKIAIREGCDCDGDVIHMKDNFLVPTKYY